MKITINGQIKQCSPNFTIESLLDELGYANKKIAVEINEEIIPRSKLKNKLIIDGDRIEIINAVGGG